MSSAFVFLLARCGLYFSRFFRVKEFMEPAILTVFFFCSNFFHFRQPVPYFGSRAANGAIKKGLMSSDSSWIILDFGCKTKKKQIKLLTKMLTIFMKLKMLEKQRFTQKKNDFFPVRTDINIEWWSRNSSGAFSFVHRNNYR